jgi:uncharacterized protein (DUF433 family)
MSGLDKMFVTANEAALVTGVPVKQVHQIIDAGLLGKAVRRSGNARQLSRKALVGLKLADLTSGVLTLDRRRQVVAVLVQHPGRSRVSADVVTVDATPAAKAVRTGLEQLAKARSVVASTRTVLSGVPVFKGTRIPVHDIAEMVANGDSVARIAKAYPKLEEGWIGLASAYAMAYPKRGRPRSSAVRSRRPKVVEVLEFDKLSPA